MPPFSRALESLRIAGDEIVECRQVFSRPNIFDGHAQKFFGRISIVMHGRFVNGKKGQRLDIVNPHRLRITFKKETVPFFAIAQGYLGLLTLGYVRDENAGAQ